MLDAYSNRGSLGRGCALQAVIHSIVSYAEVSNPARVLQTLYAHGSTGGTYPAETREDKSKTARKNPPTVDDIGFMIDPIT